MDISVVKVELPEIIQAVHKNKKAVPENLSSRIVLTEKNNIVEPSGKYCKVILPRLQSIVKNLLQNSASAVDEHAKMLVMDDVEKAMLYKPKIWYSIEEEERDAKNYLVFDVHDNAGGFAEDIIDSIYKKPIRTTKKDGRDAGEGTSYIGYFVNLMKGFIEADNITTSEGEIGARTRIYIPIE